MDLGVHLTLNAEWKPYRWRGLTTSNRHSTLLDADGFLPLDSTTVSQKAKRRELQAETKAQLELALASGIPLSHIDTHMLTMVLDPNGFKTYVSMGKRYHLPVLLEKQGMPVVNGMLKCYDVDVPADNVPIDRVVGIGPGVDKAHWMEAYQKELAPLPPGVYMLMLHLAFDNDEMRSLTGGVQGWGSQWRQNDFDMVRSAEFQTFLKSQGFILVSWKDLQKAMPQP
jgi:predicted glycoside hydrolase/deacetylase ChbG (UPF0249 family)